MMDQEVELIHRLLTHSAGFSLVLRGFLSIRADDYDWEVAWIEEDSGITMNFHKHFPEALEAVYFFVQKRHELRIGDEYK